MSKRSIQAPGSRAPELAPVDVAVIATGAPAKAIVGVLAEGRLPTRRFTCVQDLLDVEGNSLSAIVLWTEDMTSSMAGLLESLARRFKDAPIVVVCSEIQRWELRAALTSGAVGVVLYDDIEQALSLTVQAAQAGQTSVPRANWRQIEPPVLSTREKQILGLVVMGYMNSEIAARLFLAESTVKSHLSSAFSKMGVRSRNEAVQLILDPERGLGMGILGLGGEPIEAVATAAS